MAGSCQSRRWFVVALFALALFSSAVFSGAIAIGAEGDEWFQDRTAAARFAQTQGKLLLVVDLSGDFAKNAPEAREAIVYRRQTLGDRRRNESLTRLAKAMHSVVDPGVWPHPPMP